MSDDEIIEVITAHKEGKKIQAKGRNNLWISIESDHQFNFCDYEYRVAPEPRKPREWWIHPKTFPDVEFEKDRILTERPVNPAWIHVREVLD